MSPEALTSLHDDILLEWSCMAQDCLEPPPGRFVLKVKTLLRVAESLKDIEQSLDPKHPFHWAPLRISVMEISGLTVDKHVGYLLIVKGFACQ
jgi:hypothetical protein